jgi:oligoendopeptidase F
MMKKPLNPTWDLDTIFPGGSDSTQFQFFLDQLTKDVKHLRNQLESMTKEEELYSVVDLIQQVTKKIKEADSFAGCLSAQDLHDKKAIRLNGKIKMLFASFESALTLFDAILIRIEKPNWLELLRSKHLMAISFPLQERRDRALEKCPPEQEALIHDLSVDGYHGWAESYNTIVSRLQIPYEDETGTILLSAGQAANKLSHPNRKVRRQLFEKWEQAWGSHAELCADALNHISGFRLQMYKHRQWNSVHKEPLDLNRMTEQTLQTMWKVIDENKEMFVKYLKRKAELLGVEALSWSDVEAPIGEKSKEFTFEEAADLIIEQFRAFSPKMADFAEYAFEKRWIEAEDRAGKRPGGFCTSLPYSKQTRIFMTYAGTASNVATLAHELGHAYHQHVMNDLPELAQDYAMNVAETASTLAEMIVSDATVKKADNEEERLSMLEDKIQRSVAFYMNIHARYIFESKFYEARKEGLIGVEQLNQWMEEAQKEAFKNSLSEYHPGFWSSKLHFYLTDVPFYNFPYTFGYLFSAGIYAKALQEGGGFEEKYIALLRDTGVMTVEQLATKHLNENLTQPDFWQRAVDLTVKDVEDFLEMTEG